MGQVGRGRTACYPRSPAGHGATGVPGKSRGVAIKRLAAAGGARKKRGKAAKDRAAHWSMIGAPPR
jgi:hypothetical protein